jgi:hypothetical protein
MKLVPIASIKTTAIANVIGMMTAFVIIIFSRLRTSIRMVYLTAEQVLKSIHKEGIDGLHDVISDGTTERGNSLDVLDGT